MGNTTRVVEGNAPHMIEIEDHSEYRGIHSIAFGAHVGDDCKVDVIVDGEVWFEVGREEWALVVAHLSSQGFHSPTMAQQYAMEHPGALLEPDNKRGCVVDGADLHTRGSRFWVWVARRLHQPVYVATELVDGTVIYERS